MGSSVSARAGIYELVLQHASAAHFPFSVSQAELPLQFPTKGPGVYTTYRGPAERRAYLADKKELKRLEKLQQKHAELAARARDTQVPRQRAGSIHCVAIPSLFGHEYVPLPSMYCSPLASWV